MLHFIRIEILPATLSLMKTWVIKMIFRFILAVGLLFPVICIAETTNIEKHGIEFSNYWLRAAPHNHPVTAGYVDITNFNDVADTLISVSSSFAKRNEIHEMKIDGDIMKMREIPDGLILQPSEVIKLEPGGFHLMFMGLNQMISEGNEHTITLVFEKAGEIKLDFPVKKKASKHSSHKH